MAAPVAKDQELELHVESLAYGGNGVARTDGFVVFVRRGLPGDTVRARVTKVKRSHAEALATEVLVPGPARVEAPCAHYPACGGCRFQDLDYAVQVDAKEAQVREVEKCWLATELGNAIRDAVRDWARGEQLVAYDQATHEGFLRHLVVREGRNTGQTLVVLVTAPGELPDEEHFVEVLTRFPEVRSIHWAINDRPAEVT